MSVLPDPSASRAVLIGTSRYDHLEQLPAVSNNLTALADILSGPLSLRMPASHVTVIENPCDPATVMNPLRQAAAEATDTLLVYYAGHGLIDPHDTLALAMPHTHLGRIETSLNYDWLRQILLDSCAQRHIVLLDCCYSGLALGRMSALQGLANHAAVEGTFLLAASAETRTALAPIGDTHTAFTGALLDTLRHGIPGGPPLLDLESVYLHLRRTLVARAHPAPQARNRNSGARVALGRNHAEIPSAPVTATAGPEQPDEVDRLLEASSARLVVQAGEVAAFGANADVASRHQTTGALNSAMAARVPPAGDVANPSAGKSPGHDRSAAEWEAARYRALADIAGAMARVVEFHRRTNARAVVRSSVVGQGATGKSVEVTYPDWNHSLLQGIEGNPRNHEVVEYQYRAAAMKALLQLELRLTAVTVVQPGVVQVRIEDAANPVWAQRDFWVHITTRGKQGHRLSAIPVSLEVGDHMSREARGDRRGQPLR
ncbi:caspase family protein [Streptomyces sp. BV286]|uniref:caspase family protein n=1 Tax=Streptomyces sp. BV286 TaxID=2849672 RepID=UPI0020C72426|nr:caspase family protein [Streptomyces sp. BV286]